ncbi:uncharacterized protein (DUF305 family) [Prauserella isguenensis]|uniref:Uncharacterized protein (DUF305 family) n=1 Tax=Prauserella isguenensis TaxID=1470180 RepID=A0A839S3T6_9PSEU|nr:DUF305 domain-containing protein [Prauserella isguenensis]MBB3052425.1 uncharacterized protein (DUF305 family) [Prauserella isguenensis]
MNDTPDEARTTEPAGSSGDPEVGPNESTATTGSEQAGSTGGAGSDTAGDADRAASGAGGVHAGNAESEGAGVDGADVDGTRPPREREWPRYVIFGAAALALLLVGATVGLLVARGTDSEPATRPGPVDVGFAQDMSVHHLQAVTMANWARDHSSDPAVKQLAFDIASTQNEQVGRMKGWLMLWGKPEEPAGEYMTWMSEPMGHNHGEESESASSESKTSERAPSGPSGGQVGGSRAMPGMATEQELSKMRSLGGERLDVYFLQLMLRHHQGGVDMATYAREHARISAVSTLATSMLASQVPESDLMRNMLSERDAKPLPFP